MKIFPTQAERREKAFKKLEIKSPADPNFHFYPPENFPDLDAYVPYLFSQGAITKDQYIDYMCSVDSVLYVVFNVLEKAKEYSSKPLARRIQSAFL
jgi:hypothetical protein